jgi:hypothetical protein
MDGGIDTPGFAVRAKIGSSYNRTTFVDSLPPSARRLVTFPSWTASAKGSFAVSCSTELAGDSVPGNDRRVRPTYVWSWPFGQIYVKTTVQGILNGQPISGAGSGMIDTSSLFPSAVWTYYDSAPPDSDFHPFLTMLPGPLEAESGAINLWQLCGGNLNAIRVYTWPSYPGDTIGVGFYSVLVGCTLNVGIGIAGQFPDWPDERNYDIVPCVMHWTQQDSMTVAEQGTLGYIRASGETLLTNVATTYNGCRQRLPFPEVSKFYFPFVTYANGLASVCWWGRTMPESDGRQIDAWADIFGTLNGEPVSGRAWSRFDTTGWTPGYTYAYYDSLRIPDPPTWYAATLARWFALRPDSPRLLNLWSLSGGNCHAMQDVIFSLADTLHIDVSYHASGTRMWRSEALSGSYSGPPDLTKYVASRLRWHPVDSSSMSGRGQAVLVRSNGDTVVWTLSTSYDHLRRPLDFDEVVSVSIEHFRGAAGFVALTWQGTADSATSAVAEPTVTPRPPVLALHVTPNPATGATTISFVLPAPGPCRLGLYDVSGELVTTLVNGLQKPGHHNLVWNRQDARGRSIPCGVYFCTLSAENKRFRKKVVLTE